MCDRDWFQAGATGVDIQMVLENPDSENGRLDLTGSTARTLRFQLGNGTPIDKTASVLGDPKLGVIHYVTVPGDFLTAGSWMVQGFVTLADGGIAPSEVKKFDVYASL